MRHSSRKQLAAAFLVALFLPAGTGSAQITLESAFPALTFDAPVDVQHAPGLPDRLFVVEKAGIIKVFPNERTTSHTEVFLDLRDRVYSRGIEDGLLGLAFHPEYDENGRFFVYYNLRDHSRSRLSSFTSADTDPLTGDGHSEEILLEIEQPFDGHNGGQLRFGPDGYLYISIGDGGGHGENLGTGEDLQTLLGSILRLDVDRADAGKMYGIPPDNPFVGNSEGYHEEIYAYGLRNPWRFSFDRKDFQEADSTVPPQIWVADVGAGSFEEVNIVEKGGHYGWNVMEGFRCLGLKTDCDTTGRIPPVWEYDHYDGRAIIGGFVYRGSTIPSLVGKYVYGDYVFGKIWALTYADGEDPQNEDLLHADSLRIHAFGEDAAGELLIAAINGDFGKLYRLSTDPSTSTIEDESLPTGIARVGNHPNPFRDRTVIQYSISIPAHITLSIYNVLGQRVRTLVDAAGIPGEASVTWDGTDDSGVTVPAGTYLYRLSADGAAITAGNMVYLR